MNAWAFFPLYPMIVGALMRVTGGDFYVVGGFTAMAIGAAAICCSSASSTGRWGAGRPSSPSSACARSSARRSSRRPTPSRSRCSCHRQPHADPGRRYWWTAVALVLLALTRNVVIAMVPVLLAHGFVRWRKERDDFRMRDKVMLGALVVEAGRADLPLAGDHRGGHENPAGYADTMQAWKIGTDIKLSTWWNYLDFAYGWWGIVGGIAIVIGFGWFMLTKRSWRWGPELWGWAGAYPAYQLLVTNTGPSRLRYALLAFPFALFIAWFLRLKWWRRWEVWGLVGVALLGSGSRSGGSRTTSSSATSTGRSTSLDHPTKFSAPLDTSRGWRAQPYHLGLAVGLVLLLVGGMTGIVVDQAPAGRACPTATSAAALRRQRTSRCPPRSGGLATAGETGRRRCDGRRRCPRRTPRRARHGEPASDPERLTRGDVCADLVVRKHGEVDRGGGGGTERWRPYRPRPPVARRAASGRYAACRLVRASAASGRSLRGVARFAVRLAVQLEDRVAPRTRALVLRSAATASHLARARSRATSAGSRGPWRFTAWDTVAVSSTSLTMTVGSMPAARRVARRAGEALARTRCTRGVGMAASLSASPPRLDSRESRSTHRGG
jgi:hypothetical protein